MDFPAAWRSQFAGAAIEQQTIGESRADVWRITPAEAAPQFVKTEAWSRISSESPFINCSTSFSEASAYPGCLPC
ncbi:hypothetical protein EMIT0347P_10747 [Pseudomonas sp. IT-347P]|uniref:hypothetical protein n=1 Tax=Pseudomonas sp. IT-347P TaxID=3026458 RepID=UPI0039E0ECA3